MSAAAPESLAACMDKLFELVFTRTLPDINEQVKGNFKTPLQIIVFLQSLVDVVLNSTELAQDDDANKHFWKHLHRYSLYRRPCACMPVACARCA